MPVRPATRRDIPVMAQVLAASFGPDRLYQVMFPRMDEYWSDYEGAIREYLWVSWYDYRKVLTVSYTEEEEDDDLADDKGGSETTALQWNFYEQVGPFAAQFFSAPHRQIHWALEILAVLPEEQGKGFGRELVVEGLERVRRDPAGHGEAGELPVSVN
ncbi:hypothetical protein DV738_g1846, partial [Chaetothyriales sp. CBS 135597]